MATHVKLIVQDSTVEYAIDEVTRQARLRPVYNTTSPLLSRRISVRIVDTPVLNALAMILKGTGLEAKVAPDGETVMIRSQTDVVASQRSARGGTVAGRVTDSTTGAGLSGASVRVEGMPKLTAVTGDSGRFTLRNVPPGDQVLSVRLFGYRPATRTVTVIDSERTTVRIALAPVPTVLSGVVTTATGAQRKVQLGNDITTINVDSVMRVAPISTVTDLLETRVPGLTVVHSSGEPGAPSRLRLRGVGSINSNNDPVFIIDGVRAYSSQSDARNDNMAPVKYSGGPVGGAGATGGGFSAPSPIDQLDPNSIETIEVFKGPSASALYGSDAANGVIVITTKHGRAGPAHWKLVLDQGVNWIPGTWPANVFRFGYDLAGHGPICNWYDLACATIDSLRTFQALNDPRYTVLSHGSDQSASLTVSGGTPTVQYNLTGSGYGDVGNLKLPALEQQRYAAAYGAVPRWMVRPDNYTRWGTSGSLTAVPTSTFRVTLQSSLFAGNQQTSSLQQALTQLQGAYISGGTIINSQGGNYFVHPLAIYPLVSSYVERATDASVTSGEDLTFSWQPATWLPITGTGGLRTIERTDRTYIPFGIPPTGPCGTLTGCSVDTTGYYGLGRGVSHNQTVQVGTQVPLLRQHVTLALGGNYYSGTTDDFHAYTDQLAPGVSSPTSFGTACGGSGSTTLCSTATQASGAASTYGWYVEPRLNLNSRFFVSPGFRFDGGSGGTHATTTGGAAGGLSAFPRLDFSYLAVDRQGSRPLWGLISLLRPRVAFGVGGTQPAPENRLRLFNIGQVGQPLGGGGQSAQNYLTAINQCASGLPLNGTPVYGVCLSSLGNTQLRPERSQELEGGVDVTLWNERLTVKYTKHENTRKDAIISIPVAPSISLPEGAPFTFAENIGEVRNTGTEVTLNAAVLESRALSWNVGANLYSNNNVLVHLNRGQQPNYQLGLVPGYPLFGTWIKPIVSFKDLNQDHIIESDELVLGDSLVFAGQSSPKYQMNLSTDVQLLNGRLGVHGTFAYQNGMTQNNQAALRSAALLTQGNDPKTSLAYQAAVIAAICGTFEECTTTPYGLLQTVNIFRFNELSVNYEVPRAVSSWLRVPRATLALQGKNLGLHTNYRGKDPSVNAFSTVAAGDQLADYGQVPMPRSWWLTLTLGN